MKSLDSRDLSKAPPALLDPLSVLKMRGMVKDAALNGDLEWPYVRYPVQEPWTHKRGDWIPV